MRNARFVCFRFFMVPVEDELFEALADHPRPTEIFDRRVLQNADHSLPYDVQYALRVYERRGTLRFGKLSKLQMRELHEKTPDDIAEVAVEDWPYLDFVADIDPHVQAIVFRISTSVVRDVETLQNHLEEIVARTGIGEEGYAVSIRPIVDDSEFWQIVNRSEALYALRLSLKSPNLFGASIRATEALRLTREQYNNTEVDVRLKNDEGNLRLPPEEVESYREYADLGGGEWELKVREDGRERVIKSSSRAVKISLRIDLSEPLDFLRQALNRFRDRLG